MDFGPKDSAITSDRFYKFPRTPHLMVLDDSCVRGDKVMTEAERNEFLESVIYVEEKIDGANLGISFDNDGNILIQNRGGYLTLKEQGQWRKLPEWFRQHQDKLFDAISDEFILFGEWCYAKHTIYYSALPGLFIGFDLYCKDEDVFCGYEERNYIIRERCGIPLPGCMGIGTITEDIIRNLIDIKPVFGNDFIEGVYLRRDNGRELTGRAKVVRPRFIPSREGHWRDRNLLTNKVIGDTL